MIHAHWGEPVGDLPDTLVETRLALHRLAAYVVAPLRYRSTQRFGLRSTEGGFGTPVFDGRRVRIEGTQLIDENSQGERRAEIATLNQAAAFLDTAIDTETAAESDTPAVGDVDANLNIDREASLWLGRWFAMAFEALALVGSEASAVNATEPQLWPGHFDPAIEMGDDDHRASYGASPGDDSIEEPYLYLSVWWPDRLGLDRGNDMWNAPSFVGSVLRASDFEQGTDDVEMAASFWRDGRERLDATAVRR